MMMWLLLLLAWLRPTATIVVTSSIAFSTFFPGSMGLLCFWVLVIRSAFIFTVVVVFRVVNLAMAAALSMMLCLLVRSRVMAFVTVRMAISWWFMVMVIFTLWTMALASSWWFVATSMVLVRWRVRLLFVWFFVRLFVRLFMDFLISVSLRLLTTVKTARRIRVRWALILFWSWARGPGPWTRPFTLFRSRAWRFFLFFVTLFVITNLSTFFLCHNWSFQFYEFISHDRLFHWFISYFYIICVTAAMLIFFTWFYLLLDHGYFPNFQWRGRLNLS